jgi:hypothetical protein
MSIWTKVNSRNPMNRIAGDSAILGNESVRGKEKKKETGPYKITNVIGPAGGLKPSNANEITGCHFIGIDPFGQEVRVQAKARAEDLYATIGMSADSYIGKLFKITESGEGEIIDNSGTANIQGETLEPPINVVKSAMPFSIMGLFGMNFPNIGDLMSLSRRE